ncbi:SGNH/GDSL hydrolase family protein [Robertkochia solimangrovi]|uniref:SGNH/GDSL hydrolase family protein n=1 Tax=Robertkochia solimangrovi TaxID=2213046 RepID=UPI00117E3206|nr:SGNH/GDSL hydrolase family protein [Robertkochia solimangrovi]TRZ44427.1 G-D-S-L family lipolytic protein [Robertkochia solimangrovi]
MKKILYFSLIAAAFAGCQPEFNDAVNETGFYDNGEADFSTYVSVGNSLTAGYTDGAVFRFGQTNSFPNIMATQFAHAGGGEFTQPLVDDNIGGLLAGGQQIADARRVIQYSADGSPTPVILDGTPTTDITNIVAGPYNNMGVPGAKSYHLLVNGYGNIGNFPAAANPYYIRMASTPDASVIQDAVAMNPTFFTLFIGSNDILGYATSGGTGIDQTGNQNVASYGSNDITDPTVFAGVYNQLLQALTANGAKGAVASLPEVKAVPFLTTVPYNAIPLDAATAAYLNQSYAQYNGAIQQFRLLNAITEEEAAQRTISFSAGQNAVVIMDEDLTDLSAYSVPNLRQATAADFIPLPVSSVLGTLADPNDPTSVIGVGVPLNDGQVLTETEAITVDNARMAYNATIEALASNYDLAFVDIYDLITQLSTTGVQYDGGTLTSTYATGGAFSLDGVHPTARGYAVVANTFIHAINDKYGSSVPDVNPGTYPTLYVE